MIDIITALGRVGVPAGEAVAMAAGFLDEASSTIPRAGYLSFRYERAVHEADLDRRLREATERVIPRRRGRPPRR